MVDVRHPDALRLFGDGVLRLLLRADEEDVSAPLGDVAREVVGLLEKLERLLEVDDVDAAALGEDEPLHLRIPAARLVAEVDSSLQQILHGDDRHGAPLGFGWLTAGAPRENRAKSLQTEPAPPLTPLPPGRGTEAPTSVATAARR